MPRKKQSTSAVSGIANNNSGVIGSIEVNNVTKRTVEKYAEGTIGRNANMRNYIAYLLSRYYEWKKADISYGVDPVKHARIMKGLYPTLNNTIRKKFTAYHNGLPEVAFHSLSLFMHAKIDGTILGKNKRKKGEKNYKLFEEFCEMAAAEK